MTGITTYTGALKAGLIKISEWIYSNESFLMFLKLYLVCIFSTSLVLVYAVGPIKNHRIILSIKYFLKLASFYFIVNGVSDLNTFISLVVIVLTFNLLFYLTNCEIFENINERIWQHICLRKFLTMEEYTNEADVYTKLKLDELKSFCLSNECDSWKIISKLKRPRR